MIVRLLIAVTLLAAAACGAPRTPTPTPTPTPSRFGAPPVETPRDIGTIVSDPCSTVLDAGTWQQLGFLPVGRSRAVVTGEQSCRWAGPEDNDQGITVIVIPARDPLIGEYRARQFAIFQPTMIVGLPAVREQSYPNSISCTITVGTAEGQGLMIFYDAFASGPNGHQNDPCGQAQRITERIVSSLPPLPPLPPAK